jgi:hypothetical protein
MGNKSGKVILLILVFAVLFCPPAQAAIENALDLIPETAMVVLSSEQLRNDPGISYLMRVWKSNLDAKNQRSGRRGLINDVYNKLDPAGVAGAFFPAGKDKYDQLIVVKLGGVSGGRKQVDILKELLDTVLKRQEELKSLEYMGQEIIYTLGLKPGRLSSYMIIGDYVAVGSSPQLLKDALRASLGQIGSVGKSKLFADLLSRFGKSDIKILFNNADGEFTKQLRAWEKENHFTLLLSAELLDNIGLAMDIIDENKLSGEIIFSGSGEGAGEASEDIRDDAYFFDKAIQRKISAEGYSYSSLIEKTDDFLKLKFELSGLSPLWTKLFSKQQRDDLFRIKDEESDQPLSVVGRIAAKIKELYLPTGLIFIFAIIIFFILAKARKR